MKNCLKDKTVVITGASSGIGEAMACEYAAAGARVVLGARNGEKLEALCDRIEAAGGQAAWRATDVTKEDDCKLLIDTAVERFGGVDVMICNAGISMRALFDDLDLNVLRRLMDVNFWGTVYCTKYALPWLQNSASKFAMTGFLETIRIENLKKGLHVMVACPGFTASNVRFSALTADGSQQGATPRKEEKMMTPEQVAHIVERGIARRKRLCLMEIEGRATHFVKKFAPALVDRLFYYVMSKEPDSPFK